MYYTMCKNMHCRATTDDERNQVRCEYANAYSQECATINIVMKWRSKYLCRKCFALVDERRDKGGWVGSTDISFF